MPTNYLQFFILSLVLHSSFFVDPKIDASGDERKRKHTKERHRDCYGLFEMCRKRHPVRNKYRLRMSFGEVLEDQVNSRPSDRIKIRYVGRHGAGNRREGGGEVDISSTFGQDDRDFSLIYHRRGNRRENGYLNNVFPRGFVETRGISQRRIPAESEAIIPSTHNGVPGFELEYAILVRLGIFGDRGGGSETRCGDIADEIVKVSVTDASRKVENEARYNKRSRALVEGLSLVLETGEVPLQSRPGVVKIYLVLDIEIRAPMTDLG